MKESLCFSDVLIQPKFSFIRSREDVDTSSTFMGEHLLLPIVSSNMDTVTSSVMAKAMSDSGALGCLHRFCTIDENVKMYVDSQTNPIVSIGLGRLELDRAEVLIAVGANKICIDVAHGASIAVVEQFTELKNRYKDNIQVMVGNFANAEGIEAFNFHCKYRPDVYKVGLGGGSACLTRVVTGCGLPTLESIIDCSRAGYDVIADGGCRTSGDIVKALAAGAKAVMLGGMLAGTEEAPGEPVVVTIPYYEGMELQPSDRIYMPIGALDPTEVIRITQKKYRGSASAESYGVQGKTASHRAPEGDSFFVSYKGPVANVLQGIEGGLRSAMSYVGAYDLQLFREHAKLIKVSNNSVIESGAHGRKS